MQDPERINQAYWDELAPVHLKAYTEVQSLRDGGISLDELELTELGEVSGKSMLHLQCHIGTDSLSWVRQGARVTAVDFSRESLKIADELSRELGLAATFIESNLYDLHAKLDTQFDIVYTSRGVLCWLKDIGAWGQIIASYLKPGGTFYIMESHPILNIYDDKIPGRISHPYFNTPEPLAWDDDDPDYADENYIPNSGTREWSWSMSEILTALLRSGLQIDSFQEHERLFFKMLPDMEALSDGWYHMPHLKGKLPLMFTLRASKPR